MADGEVDPRGETLAAATMGAGAAARTLTEGVTTRPRAASTDALIGKHLAHFRIEKRIGRGGMGEVYLATDLALDRPVAVKVLSGEIANDASARGRFVREARAQARINHPNICHIYFIGEQDERLFFAMEYVDGENLQQRLERLGRLPHAEALELARMAAAGLAEAQRHGFIHRDVKPSNLLIDKNGVLKVADFGLVKDGGAADAAETGGVIVGTPLYMAPEQARGEALDFRADIYALGVTLHQLVAGSPPFVGATPLAIVSLHLTGSRPHFDRGTARGALLVDELCDRMMAKRPEARFASYDQLLTALDEASPRHTRPAGGWPRFFASALDWILAFTVGGILDAVTSRIGVQTYVMVPLVAAAYFIIGPALWGRSLGKHALDMQIVAEGGRRGIGWRRALVRFFVEWAPVFLCVALASAVDLIGMGWPEVARTAVEVVLGCLGAGWIVVCGLLAVRSVGKRAIWDRLAGTRVVYQRS